MDHLFDLWPLWLAIPIVLTSFLWPVSRPSIFGHLSRLEWSVLFIVAFICAGTMFFFQHEPWLGLAHTQKAGVYAPVAATILSGFVVVCAAIIRYQRERARPPA